MSVAEALPPPSEAAPESAAPQSNPFQGLAYFDIQHAASFAGRARDIQDLTSEILRCRKLILYGRSGLGKTSLLLAGVFPKLQEHRCKTVYVRALLDPALEMFTAAHEQLKGNQTDDLRTLIQQHDKDGPVVIVFDQFEEFFIRFSERPNAGQGERTKLSQADQELRSRFIAQISALADDTELDLRLLFSLREDWLAEMESFEAFLPSIMHSTYRLLPLTAFGVRESMSRVLKVGGIRFEPQLVSGLVEQLAEVNFDPAVLQVMCTEVWSHARRRSGGVVERLELRDLVSVGDLDSVFARYLEQVTTRLPEEEPAFALQVRAVLAAMITSRHTKHAAPRTEFLNLYFKVDGAQLDRVLSLLVEQRLVRKDERRGGPWYELIHERLIPSILRWLERDGEFFRFRDALNTVRTLSSNPGWREHPERLLNRGQLAGVIGPYKTLLNFAEHERLFVLYSAVYSGADDIEYWADANAREGLERLIREFLKSGHDDARISAARAIERLPALAEFRHAARALALEDPVPAVRSAAARAFARRVPDTELPELAAALNSSPRPPYILDLAAEVLRERGGNAPLSWGLYWRWRARQRLHQQRLRERAAAVAAAQARVWLPAVVTSVLAGLTLVPFVVYTALCVTDPTEVQELSWLGPTLAISIASTVFASFCAWRMGRRGIAAAVREDQQATFARAMRLPDLGWLCGVAGAIALLSIALNGADASDISLCVALTLSGFTLMPWCYAVGRSARASVASARSMPARVLWASVWSVASTFAPALWIWLALGTEPGRAYIAWAQGDEASALLRTLGLYTVYAPMTAPVVAVLGFVGLVVIAVASPLPGEERDYRVAADPIFPARQIRRERLVGAMLLAVAACELLVAHGIDLFPWTWTASSLRLSPAGERITRLTLEPGPVREDSAFVRLQLDGERPAVVRYQLVQPPKTTEEFAFYAVGSTLLPPVHFTPELRGEARVEVERLAHIDDDVVREAGWQFHVVKYQAGDDEGEWRGRLDLEVEMSASALEVCFVDAALARAAVELSYGEPGREDRELETTARAGLVRLPGLRRAPVAGDELGDILSQPALCETYDIEAPAMTVRKELPPLRSSDEQPTSSALSTRTAAPDDIHLLFLVRGVARADDAGVPAGGAP